MLLLAHSNLDLHFMKLKDKNCLQNCSINSQHNTQCTQLSRNRVQSINFLIGKAVSFLNDFGKKGAGYIQENSRFLILFKNLDKTAKKVQLFLLDADFSGT